MYNNSNPYGGVGGGMYGNAPPPPPPAGSFGGSTQTDKPPYGSSQPKPPNQKAPSAWNPAAASSNQNGADSSQGPPGVNTSTPSAPSYWNPTTAAAAVKMMSGGGSDAAVDAARQIATQFAVDGWARFVPGLEKFMTSLRVYFAVDNKYVKRKLTTILFPFLKKNWRRTEVEAKQRPDGTLEILYALPVSDENAPDLYLPSMSLVSYCILCAVLYGASGEFNPEVLPDIMSKCFVTQLLEVLAIRFGLYLMQAPVAFLDLFAFTGYKYFGLCLNMLIGISAGRKAYYGALLWTAACISFMMLKVMTNSIPRQTAASGPKREFMVLGFAGSQLATMWFLSDTKYLA